MKYNETILDKVLSQQCRFIFNEKTLTLEDLYQLSQQELDTLYKQYSKEYDCGLIKENKNKTIKLKLDTIKHVFMYNKELEKKEQTLLQKRLAKNKLMRLLEDEKYKNYNKKELEKMIDDF